MNKLPRKYKLYISFMLIGIAFLATLPSGCSSDDDSSRGFSLNSSGASLSPDGSKTLKYHGRSLYIVNPDGTDEKELVSGDDISWAMNVVWSPDSSKVAYRMWWPVGSKSEIWVINANGSDRVMVGGMPKHYTISSIVWSADNAQITYTGQDSFPSSDSQYELGPDITHAVNADGSSY